MTANLVIVESPAKAKTIERYLGKDFTVLASYGHVRDLIRKDGAVDPADNFAMKFEIGDDKKTHVDKITKALKKADALYLATDPDREGEAISWHLYGLLDDKGLLKDKDVHRVIFHEITKRAIKEAMQHPRELSHSQIDAYLARRALDHLVGFNLSPLLWRKVSRGLSAGRVQSPALCMIVERELDIEKFEPKEYWTIEAALQKDKANFAAKLNEYDGEKVKQFTFTNETDAKGAQKALNDAAGGKLTVSSIEKKQRKRNPAPPFITSTLQQEASRKLGFSTQRTMRTAQQLYEGIDLGGETIGLITYMRTDATVLAAEAVTEIREVIDKRYGAENVPKQARVYKTSSKNAQEAHEAIRPTSAARVPAEVKDHLSADQAKLYELIWKRTVACQMIHATFDTVAANLTCDTGTFRATGSTLVSPGFMAVYQEGKDDSKNDDDDGKNLPPMEEGDVINLAEVKADQHFTEPPPRYTEASLVKTLEEYGIGRPSTYASIIQTLLGRKYVELESRRFTPTDTGRIVAKFLIKHFTQYVDYSFTANLEDDLDAISRGEKEWVPLLDEFWQPFKSTVDEKAELSREEVAEARLLGEDPKTGKPVTVRMGQYGAFVQIGTKDDEDKPQFAGLLPGQKMDAITFEDAMELFKLPRALGETDEGEKVSANIGRFGPYVRYANKFVSIPKEESPYDITLERALELVAQKKKEDAEKIIKVFEDTDIQILKGRYGPYITDGKKNAKIPKDREPESLTLAECEEAIANAPAKKGRGGRKKAAPKKAAEKKPAAKKAATKKAPAKKAAAKKPAAKKPATKKAAATKKPAAKTTAAKKATTKKATTKKATTKSSTKKS